MIDDDGGEREVEPRRGGMHPFRIPSFYTVLQVFRSEHTPWGREPNHPSQDTHADEWQAPGTPIAQSGREREGGRKRKGLEERVKSIP